MCHHDWHLQNNRIKYVFPLKSATLIGMQSLTEGRADFISSFKICNVVSFQITVTDIMIFGLIYCMIFVVFEVLYVVCLHYIYLITFLILILI